MKTRMSTIAKSITVITIILLIAVLFFPIWKIELSAPQYPEGLTLKIYPDKLGGDIEIVNGLNHYIGMRTLHTRDFVEFAVLPYIFGILAFFGLLTLLRNRKWFFISWAGFFFLFAIVAMIDFYRWEYNYGHNLDPAAPIQVPGMSYTPPLIGFKQLLNFGAYSIPDIGGWLFIAAGVLLAIGVIKELSIMKKPVRPSALIVTVTILLLFSSCNSGPQPIQFNKDACDFCKMTLTDTRFGAELVTRKGKVFTFDDTECLFAFRKKGTVPSEQVGKIYLVDYAGNGRLIESGNCILLKSDELRSPMGGHLAAFESKEAAAPFQQQFNGTLIQWHETGK